MRTPTGALKVNRSDAPSALIKQQNLEVKVEKRCCSF